MARGNFTRTPLSVRFERNVNRETASGCWEWTGAKTGKGYGAIGAGGTKGKMLVAHRVSWEIHRCPIPDGLVLCHRCDNRGCVNPEHLFVGTQRDNILDMFAKGRAPSQKGEHHLQKRTHCPQGHPLEGENLVQDRLRRGKGRHCRICHNASGVRRQRRRAAERKAAAE